MCILIYLYMDLSAPPLQYFRFTHFGRGVVDELDAHRKKKKNKHGIPLLFRSVGSSDAIHGLSGFAALLTRHYARRTRAMA